eukprot:Awhi_evm1s10342
MRDGSLSNGNKETSNKGNASNQHKHRSETNDAKNISFDVVESLVLIPSQGFFNILK